MSFSLLDFAIEATGSLIAIAAYRTHRCTTRWHRFAIWTVLTLATTLVTNHRLTGRTVGHVYKDGEKIGELV